MTAQTTQNGSTTPAPAPEHARKPIPGKDKLALFQAKDKLDAEVSALESKLETARGKRQAIAQEVYEKMGQGPFVYNGSRILVTKRTETRGENPGKVTYHFRGPSDAEGEVIG